MLSASSDVHLSLKATFGIKGLTQFPMKLLCVWPRGASRNKYATYWENISVMLGTGNLWVQLLLALCLLSPNGKWVCACIWWKYPIYLLKKKVICVIWLWNTCTGCLLGSVQNCGIEAKALMLFRCSNPLDFLGIHWFQWEWGGFSSSGSCSKSEKA